MRFIVIALLLGLSSELYAGSAKIYVWRNSDGILVYSDSPKPGAEEVEISDPNISNSSVDTSILDIIPKAIENSYQVEITQPADSATIRDNTGSVYVSGRIKPIFKKGLKIALTLDGTPHLKPQNNSIFVLRNIERGEHQIKMDLLDEKGKIIASSSPITFYMHRASVNKAN
ncbi:DUF4124 domain-containing protein [Thalassotalea piscium]